jgi:hypothetical protein
MTGTMNDADRLEGFRVVSSGGYVGTVVEVVYGTGYRPSALVIRSGLFARQLVRVAMDEVLHAYHDNRLLVLARSWRSGVAKVSEAPRAPSVTSSLDAASPSARLIA